MVECSFMNLVVVDLNPVDDLTYWENLLKTSIKISVKRFSNKVKWEIQKLNSWMFWLPKVMCTRYYVIFFFHIKQIKWELLNSSCNTVVRMWGDVHFQFFFFPTLIQKGKHLKIHKALQPLHLYRLQSV